MTIQGKKRKKFPLKTVYYLYFLFLIVIPILTVLVLALFVLNRQFRQQAKENIRQAQETVITELVSDIDVMSMRLSHLIYTNDNEILVYAAGTDTGDGNRRYEYQQRLEKAGNLALEPVKDVISVGFYMKDGRQSYIKSEIHRSAEEVKASSWYRSAEEKKNVVCVGAYDTKSLNDLYTGGKKDALILVFALAPDVTTDRSQKIEMVVFYHSTGAADRIRQYNQDYRNGKNRLGITQIRNQNGEIIFSTTDDELNFTDGTYTCIRTPLELKDTVWYIESYIKTRDLSLGYGRTASAVFLAAVLVLLLAGYYSRFFLRSIVSPVEEISRGLRQVEEGHLNVHIVPEGQYEIRSMIHQFNAMARRLKALIEEYEERVQANRRRPEDDLAALLRQELTPEEVAEGSKEFFAEPYTLIGIWAESRNPGEGEENLARQMESCFERNPRFASRCISCRIGPYFFIVFYRISEDDYEERAAGMIRELQKTVSRELDVSMSACIGKEASGPGAFAGLFAEIQRKMCLAHLYGENAVVPADMMRGEGETLLQLSEKYRRLAEALYTADEKNMTEEKQRMFDGFHNRDMAELRQEALAVILAVGICFGTENNRFVQVFGQRFDYPEKLARIEDARSLKLWLTNYFAWIMDYSASRLAMSEEDVIVRAKRYIADHCEEPDLSLADVAGYAGLNEKYFSNRFTKETGETFSSYLTALRMQKARELLKTTSFKVYEISEMAGYHSVEHFNRVFKKINGVTPAQYRKTM